VAGIAVLGWGLVVGGPAVFVGIGMLLAGLVALALDLQHARVNKLAGVLRAGGLEVQRVERTRILFEGGVILQPADRRHFQIRLEAPGLPQLSVHRKGVLSSAESLDEGWWWRAQDPVAGHLALHGVPLDALQRFARVECGGDLLIFWGGSGPAEDLVGEATRLRTALSRGPWDDLDPCGLDLRVELELEGERAVTALVVDMVCPFEAARSLTATSGNPVVDHLIGYDGPAELLDDPELVEVLLEVVHGHGVVLSPTGATLRVDGVVAELDALIDALTRLQAKLKP